MFYPDLSKEKAIAFDIETKGLNSYDSSGYILGVAIATRNGFKQYYNLNSNTNLKESVATNCPKNLEYIKNILALPCLKIGAYLPFEFSWLENSKYNIKINGPIYDVQAAEYIINSSSPSFSLDYLLKTYGIGEKQSDIPIKELNKLSVFDKKESVEPEKHFRKYLYVLLYEHIKEYALGDVYPLFELMDKQMQIIKQNNLEQPLGLEMQMIKICSLMHHNGCLLDMTLIKQLETSYIDKLFSLQYRLNEMVGYDLNVRSNKQLFQTFTELKIPFKINEKGNGKFGAEEIVYINHPIAKLIVAIRNYKDILSKFIHPFYEFEINNILHGRFHSTISKGGDTKGGGTITGRLSSSDPNIQNIPARDQKYDTGYDISFGKDIRSVFIPLPDCQWGSIDLSQIEYRTFVNIAVGEKAKEARQAYINDPNMDYHKFVMDLTSLERKPAKNCNFLMLYRGGPNILAKKLNCEVYKAKQIMELYFTKLPFAKTTAVAAENFVKKNGYITTLGGRKIKYSSSDNMYRAFAHYNQGSAADYLKAGLVKAFEMNLFDHKAGNLYLHSTVHDENNVSVAKTKQANEAFYELKRCMETAIELKIPVKADANLGENWYAAK